jgi:hypothetical protein
MMTPATPISDEVITALLSGAHINLCCAALNQDISQMNSDDLRFELSKQIIIRQLISEKMKAIVDLLTTEQKLQAASVLLGFSKADA